MLPSQLESALIQIEAHCVAVAAAVAQGETSALLAASQTLRQTAQDFHALMQEASLQGAAPALRARLRLLATQIASQRENLLRRSALTDRALQTLLPTHQSASGTYADARSAYRGFAG